MRSADWVNSMKKNACVITTIVAAVIIFMFIHAVGEGSECTMAQQLLDPLVRGEYESVIASGRIEEESGCTTAHLNGNDNAIIDPISLECINCHDGTLASSVTYNLKTTGDQKALSTITLSASHPIGTDYLKYSCNKGFTYWRNLPAEMVLMNGQIGCASCHNLLGSNDLYLVVDMSSSGLCFSCHRK